MIGESQPTCAVCGRSVAPDTDHVVVEAETKRMRDRNEVDNYYLHERCAMNALGSWEKP
jgi:hypothetical protein